MEKTNSFKQFIKDASNQRELPLALAKDTDQFYELHNLLKDEGFKGTDKIYRIVENPEDYSKGYIVINEHNYKQVYDFVIQYPTGQVNYFDQINTKNFIFTPDYKKQTLILLTTNEFMLYLQNNRLNFLEIVGMVYRSKE